MRYNVVYSVYVGEWYLAECRESMNNNFCFPEKDFSMLFHFGQLAEEYYHSDPNACLMKL